MIRDLIQLSWELIKDVFNDQWLWSICIMAIVLLIFEFGI